MKKYFFSVTGFGTDGSLLNQIGLVGAEHEEYARRLAIKIFQANNPSALVVMTLLHPAEQETNAPA